MKRNEWRRRVFWALLCGILVLGFGRSVTAQEYGDEAVTNQQERSAAREERRRKIRERIAQKLAERLDLTDEQVSELMNIEEKYRKERIEVRKRLQEEGKKLRDLVKDEESSDAEIEAQLDVLRKIQEEQALLAVKLSRDIEKILGPRKAAELLLIKERMKRMLRNRMRGRNRGRGQGGNRRGWGGEER